jgi:hypothetical protein
VQPPTANGGYLSDDGFSNLFVREAQDAVNIHEQTVLYQHIDGHHKPALRKFQKSASVLRININTQDCRSSKNISRCFWQESKAPLNQGGCVG